MFDLAEPVAFCITGEIPGGSVLCLKRAEVEPAIEQVAKQYAELCQDPAIELGLDPYTQPTRLMRQDRESASTACLRIRKR